MRSVRPSPTEAIAKASTGIAGFDEITGGGLPRGRTTLLMGGPGSGKTIFALQFLVHGARDCKEAGLFVAFEETSKRIATNAAGFGWDLAKLQKTKLFFIDAQPIADNVQAGDFDLGGMFAALEARIKQTRARRIVFDALDIVLALLPDPAAKRREVYRLHEWLLARGLTALITAKAGGDEASSIGQQPYGFMQFMVDCAVILNHGAVLGVSQRSMRVQKYRGTSFDENESSFLIGREGIEVPVPRRLPREHAAVTGERVSSGVARLDTMLGGGYYRGATVLITGYSGTAKTTLSGAFAEAACRRGERTILISFDTDGDELIRNLASVGIRLDRYVRNGTLRLVSARAITGSAESYLVSVKALAKEHRARCVVIDPVSTWSKSGNDLTAQSIAERLIDWSKADGITMVCTRLLDEMSAHPEGGAPLQISTLADTWIHLNYLVQAGERNRGLSIMKSRGTAHSNQVRELLLSGAGVTLADTYTAGGEVLMGTMRWEKERAERAAEEMTEVDGRLKRVRLEAEEAELQVRVQSLRVELEAKQVEKALLARTAERRKGDSSRSRSKMGELRRADAAHPEREESA
jgi:circadian clock protein KaiC